MVTATVTSKGQITIPKEIRVYAMIRSGTEVEFQIECDGRITMIPISRDITALKRIAYKKRKKAVSLEEIEKAIKEGAKGASQ